MTNDDLPSTITESLEFESELNYLSWKVSVENFAVSKATIMAPSGLLTEILNDSEWNKQTLNRSQSPNGTLTIARRPVAPAHTPITIGMTNAAISVAKYDNDRHQTWHDAQVSFKSALIRSLGPTLEGAIGPPPGGIQDDFRQGHHGRSQGTIWQG
jgi:hypothetical protein